MPEPRRREVLVTLGTLLERTAAPAVLVGERGEVGGEDDAAAC